MTTIKFDAKPGDLVSESVTGTVKKALYWKEKGKNELYKKQIEKLINWEKEDMVKSSGLGLPLAKTVEDQTKSYIRAFLSFENL